MNLIDRLLSWAFDHRIVKEWGRTWHRGDDGQMHLVRRWWRLNRVRVWFTPWGDAA